MRVVFAKLDHMIEELKDRLIHEVRVEPMRKNRTFKGVLQVTLFVSVEALVDKELIATYQQGVYSGVWHIEVEKQQELLERNKQRAAAIRHELSHTFKVRRGHYKEGS